MPTASGASRTASPRDPAATGACKSGGIGHSTESTLLRAIGSALHLGAGSIDFSNLILGWHFFTNNDVGRASVADLRARSFPGGNRAYTATPPPELIRYAALAEAIYKNSMSEFLRVASTHADAGGLALSRNDVILYKEHKSSTDLLPPHAIVLDRARRTIVLVFRGTKDWHDLFVDLAGVPVPRASGGAAHEGMATLADRLLSARAFAATAPQARVCVSARAWADRGGWLPNADGDADVAASVDTGAAASAAAAAATDAQVFVPAMSPGELVQLRCAHSSASPHSGASAAPPPPASAEWPGPYEGRSGILFLLQRLVGWSAEGLLDGGEVWSATGDEYAGWSVATVGHSLGASIAMLTAIAARDTLIFPGMQHDGGGGRAGGAPRAVPVFAYGYGVPAAFDATLAATASLSIRDCATLRGEYVPRARCLGAADISRPFFCGAVMGDDIVPRLSVASIAALSKTVSSPALSTHVRRLAFTDVARRFGAYYDAALSSTDAVTSRLPAVPFSIPNMSAALTAAAAAASTVYSAAGSVATSARTVVGERASVAVGNAAHAVGSAASAAGSALSTAALVVGDVAGVAARYVASRWRPALQRIRDDPRVLVSDHDLVVLELLASAGAPEVVDDNPLDVLTRLVGTQSLWSIGDPAMASRARVETESAAAAAGGFVDYVRAWKAAHAAPNQELMPPGALFHGCWTSDGERCLWGRFSASSFFHIVPSTPSFYNDHSATGYSTALNAPRD